MIQKNSLNTSFVIIFVSACCVSWLVNSAIAQIIPDDSLGEGRSRLTRNIEIRGESSDRIDGGITRSTSLFHSFVEFWPKQLLKRVTLEGLMLLLHNYSLKMKLLF
ncbi:MAG: hypothetical protein F6K30_29720 [Cyanothece sp. SIO2G6]|nr:hypothetical protein [Cyanothece sp. SIO2G6]